MNFKELQLKSLSGQIIVIDVREIIAEQIYSKLGGLKFKLLAEKIYRSEGDFEIDEKEAEALGVLVADDSEFFNNKVSDAIKAQLEN